MKTMLSCFYDSKRIIHKEFILEQVVSTGSAGSLWGVLMLLRGQFFLKGAVVLLDLRNIVLEGQTVTATVYINNLKRPLTRILSQTRVLSTCLFVPIV